MLNIFGNSFVKKELLKRVFKETLKEAKKDPKKVINLSFVSSQKIKELNGQYRKRNKITDVLSFEADFFDKNFLGDILICVSQAKKQAKERNQNPQKEICLLLIHGILHLLGFDHKAKKDKEKMEKFQEKILNKIFGK